MSFPPTTLHGTGWVEVICGSMFSGKTEELIRRLKRAQIARQKVQIFKPRVDVRFAVDEVISHSSLRLQAEPLEHVEELFARIADHTRVVGIDEAQFFSPSILDIVHRLADRGLRVIVAGLDLDYKGRPFGPMPALMATAEFVTKTSAICSVCGNVASRSQRLPRLQEPAPAPEGSPVLIGGAETYEARCRRCFEPPND